MQRPTISLPSMAPQDPAGSKPSKAAYRLFPSVEPTPPASPVSPPQKAAANGTAEESSSRSRSPSLDFLKKTPSSLNLYGPRQAQDAGAPYPKTGSASDARPMARAQDLPLDVRTAPPKSAATPSAAGATDSDAYGLSRSAPSERGGPGAAGQHLPFAPRPEQDAEWRPQPLRINRPAPASPHTVRGPGVGLASSPDEERAPIGVAGQNARQDLKLSTSTDQNADLPPPPPPKPPRHGRSASVHSQASSAHSRASSRDGSPIAVSQPAAYYSSLKPTYISRSAPARSFHTAMRSPAPMPPRSGATSPPHVLRASEADHASTRNGIPPVPIAPLPLTESAEKTAVDARPPLSKFGSAASTTNSALEDERTPKVIPPQSEPHLTTTNPVANFAAKPNDQAWVRSPRPEDVPPPPPRKDSLFVSQKTHDEGRKLAPKKSIEAFRTHRHKKSDGTIKVRLQKADDIDRRPPPLPLKDHHDVPQQPAGPQKLVPRDESPKSVSPLSPSIKLDSLSARQPPPPLPSPSIEMPSRPAVPKPSLKTPVVDRRPSHEFADRSAGAAAADPEGAFADLSKQTETLHKRYAGLRLERQQLSIAIMTNLREQKAGPEYVNTLLDQHFALATINSSMDICFAKLKALECRKEEAMMAIIAHNANKGKAEKTKKVESPPPEPVTSSRAAPAPPSGYTTPDMTPDVSTHSSPRKLQQDLPPHPDSEQPDRRLGPAGREPTSEPQHHEKNNTTSKHTPTVTSVIGESDVPSGTSTNTDPKKFYMNGSKAAKILGLVEEVAYRRPGSPSTTLPDGLRAAPVFRAPQRGRSVDVRGPSASWKALPPIQSPAPTKPLPTPRARLGNHSISSTSSIRSGSDASGRGAHGRAASSAGSSSSSSLFHENVRTPKDGVPPAMSLPRAKKGRFQTVQVYAHNGILDYYQYSPDLDGRAVR